MDIREPVRQKGQEFIAHFVPEKADLPGGSHETRSVDCIRLAGQQRGQHRRIILRRVLEIRVLNDDERSGRLPEAADQRRAFALIDLLVEQADSRVICEFLQIFPGFVGRSIVDDQEFADFGTRQHPVDDFIDGLLFVVGGHHDGKASG